MNEKQSIHRPAWTQDNLHAYRHLYLPVRNKHRKVVAPIRKNHFLRTQGFLHYSDLQLAGGGNGN